MAKSLKNAAAGMLRVVQAFLAGERAREGRRPDYKAGARYSTDGLHFVQWGNIVARKLGGSIEITDSGWRTKTTREVLNAILRATAANARIYQKAHEWFLQTPKGTVPWRGKAMISLGDASVTGNRKRSHRNSGTKIILQSNKMIYAPGLIRWIKVGYSTSKGKQKKMFADLIHGTWQGVPPDVGRAMAAGKHPYEVEGENVVVIVKGRGGKLNCNPLTKSEAAKALKSANAHLRHASFFRPGPTRYYHAGVAAGVAGDVQRFGPRKAWKAASKVGSRVVKIHESSLTNPLASLKNMHTATERERAKRLVTRYYDSGMLALQRGQRDRAAHAYGALAAIRRLARLERPVAQTVANLASFRMDCLRRKAKGR